MSEERIVYTACDTVPMVINYKYQEGDIIFVVAGDNYIHILRDRRAI